MNPPKIIAHRGFWKTKGAFENSKQAVEEAIRHQLDGVEVDLRMSKDGVIYLAHNRDIQGTVIHQNSSGELDKIILPNGENPAKLEDFMERVKGTDLRLYVEIKKGPNRIYHEQIVHKTLISLKDKKLLQQTVILSFSEEILSITLSIFKEVKTMFLVEDPELDLMGKGLFKADYIGLDFVLVKDKPEILDHLHQSGYKINLWTVNDLSLAKEFCNYPVHSLTSDDPLFIKQHL